MRVVAPVWAGWAGASPEIFVFKQHIILKILQSYNTSLAFNAHANRVE